ncbi:MAG: hypothetical protein KDI47_16065, partial [Gammaproteobacteria bacterium]|nr:hypothetical protein [Gammaproteobacteria bacterium]
CFFRAGIQNLWIGKGTAQLYVLNSYKKIWETRKMLASANPSDKMQLQRSLKGRIQEAKQITNKDDE